MNNKSISDFVASSMDAVLKSDQHKSLFNGQYKIASDENDAKKHDKEEGSHSAWDSDDQLHVKDSNCAACGKDQDHCYCWSADDQELASSDDAHMSASAALDVAIEGLLTASAALDSVGIDDGSTVSLKLASLIVQAKKEMSSADKKKLVARLQKGKKGKKPAAKASKPASKSDAKSTKPTSKPTSKPASKPASKSDASSKPAAKK